MISIVQRMYADPGEGGYSNVYVTIGAAEGQQLSCSAYGELLCSDPVNPVQFVLDLIGVDRRPSAAELVLDPVHVYLKII